MIRRLSNEEQADLPDNSPPWENFTESGEMYYVSFLKSWEVDKKTYEFYKNRGVLCLAQDEKYYIAR